MSKRRELEQRQQEQSRKQMIQVIAIIAGLAIVVIGGAAILSNNTSLGNKAPEVPLPAPQPVARTIPANAEGYGWGPKDAPIKIEEFIDYQCPACGAQWAANEDAIIVGLAKSGKVRYDYRFLTFLQSRKAGSTESEDAANAAMCAADQGKFLEMHNILFGNQFDENVGQFSIARLKTMGGMIQGLDTAKFNSCVDGGTHKATVTEMANEANAKQVGSTPTFVVNGKNEGGGKTLTELKAIIARIDPSLKFE